MHRNTDHDPSTADSITSDTPAAIHRRMGAAGSRLNDGHAHLSALRSAMAEDSETSPDVTEAELEALVHALEDAQQRLDEALDLATNAASELSDGTTEPTETDDPKEGTGMLWNTTGYSYPIPNSTEQ